MEVNSQVFTVYIVNLTFSVGNEDMCRLLSARLSVNTDGEQVVRFFVFTISITSCGY